MFALPLRLCGPTARFRTILGVAALTSGLFACGGGGGGSTEEPPPGDLVPLGIQGMVLLPDLDQGRIVEQEPNGGADQAFRLPPLSPGTELEITGEVGIGAQHFGLADPIDRFRLEVQADQDVSLSLFYTPIDPVGGGDNDLRLAVHDAAGTLLAQAVSGPTPRTTAFRAVAGLLYDVTATCAAGHASYVLACASTDPASALRAGMATAPIALRRSSPSAPAGVSPCATTHLLVRVRASADAEGVARRFGLTLGRRTATGSFRFRFPEGAVSEGGPQRLLATFEDWRTRLVADSDVLSVEPDWRVHSQGTSDDPELARQWSLQVIGAPAAWDYTKGDADIVIGVIDSGIVQHPDLIGRVVAGYDFVSDPTIAGDGDGRDDDPTDVGAQEAPSGRSVYHGTHVAAIIAGNADDGYGIAGIAPHCRLMPLRAVGITGGYVSDVADALLFAAGLHTTADGTQLAEPLPIVNLSLGLDVDTLELRTACEAAADAGVLLVGAAGNTGTSILYPARYDSVLCVGAVNRKLGTTSYSPFGSAMDIAAPGGSVEQDDEADGWPDGILSAVLDDTVHPPVASHALLQGTSQAAPHVAGAAALLLALDPTLDRAALRNLLLGGALDRGAPGKDEIYGWGVLQVQESLRQLLENRGAPRTDAPILQLSQASVALDVFGTSAVIPVFNFGGGRLELAEPTAATDDGAPWLGAINIYDTGGGPTAVQSIVVTVDRGAVPATPTRYSGTVFVAEPDGTVRGTIRVVFYVSQQQHAGRNRKLLVRDASTGFTVASGIASPAQGYRFWFPHLDPGAYRIMGGTDLDGDGFICEVGDACGWHGGATEAESVVIDVVQSQAVMGADVVLQAP